MSDFRFTWTFFEGKQKCRKNTPVATERPRLFCSLLTKTFLFYYRLLKNTGSTVVRFKCYTYGTWFFSLKSYLKFECLSMFFLQKSSQRGFFLGNNVLITVRKWKSSHFCSSLLYWSRFLGGGQGEALHRYRANISFSFFFLTQNIPGAKRSWRLDAELISLEVMESWNPNEFNQDSCDHHIFERFPIFAPKDVFIFFESERL